MKTTLQYRRIIIWASLFGFLLGGLLTGIGFMHNSQQEFFTNSGSVDFVFVGEIFLSWFIAGFVVFSIVMFFLEKLKNRR